MSVRQGFKHFIRIYATKISAGLPVIYSRFNKQYFAHFPNSQTVKPVLSGHSNKDKMKVLRTDDSLMQV